MMTQPSEFRHQIIFHGLREGRPLFFFFSVSLYMYVCMYVSIYLSTSISIYPSIYPYLYPYLYLYLHRFLSIYLSIYLFIYLSIYIYFDLSIYLSIYAHDLDIGGLAHDETADGLVNAQGFRAPHRCHVQRLRERICAFLCVCVREKKSVCERGRERGRVCVCM